MTIPLVNYPGELSERDVLDLISLHKNAAFVFNPTVFDSLSIEQKIEHLNALQYLVNTETIKILNQPQKATA